MPSTVYTDLTRFTVWLNQMCPSQMKEDETLALVGFSLMAAHDIRL